MSNRSPRKEPQASSTSAMYPTSQSTPLCMTSPPPRVTSLINYFNASSSPTAYQTNQHTLSNKTQYVLTPTHHISNADAHPHLQTPLLQHVCPKHQQRGIHARRARPIRKRICRGDQYVHEAHRSLPSVVNGRHQEMLTYSPLPSRQRIWLERMAREWKEGRPSWN